MRSALQDYQLCFPEPANHHFPCVTVYLDAWKPWKIHVENFFVHLQSAQSIAKPAPQDKG
jgi:hypothetical protein